MNKILAVARAEYFIAATSKAFILGIFMMPVFMGGVLRWFGEKTAPSENAASERRERGVLFGSGLVGGEGLFGVAIAGFAAYTAHTPEGFGYGWAGAFAAGAPAASGAASADAG